MGILSDSGWMRCRFHTGRAARVPVLCAWDPCTNFHLLSVQPVGQNADFHVFQIRRRWGRWFLSTNFPAFPQKNCRISDKPWISARHSPLHTTVNHPPHLQNRRKTEKFFCIMQKQMGKSSVSSLAFRRGRFYQIADGCDVVSILGERHEFRFCVHGIHAPIFIFCPSNQ